MNAVGTGGDVRTMLHECGHAFHVFQNSRLPFIHQRRTTSEFNEVASMAMELLAAPYIDEEHGGFFSAAEAARYRRSHLEKIILFWPYMAVVDAFQHWVYTHMDQAVDPMACDAKWAELWDRFMPGIDFSGYEDWKRTGWHRKLHIFQAAVLLCRIWSGPDGGAASVAQRTDVIRPAQCGSTNRPSP